MKTFDFKLTTLLKVRTEAEKASHRALMKSHVHLKNMLKIIELLETEYYVLTESIEHQKAKISVVELEDQHEYMQRLEKKIKLQIEEVVKAQMEVEEKRLLVVQASQRKITIENLREKQYSAWEKVQQIKEAVYFDEVSSLLHERGKRLRTPKK